MRILESDLDTVLQLSSIIGGMGKTIEDLANDTVYIQKSDDTKLGPYKAAVNSKKAEVEVFADHLDIEVGDKLLRPAPFGLDKEEVYEVLDIHYEVPIADVFAPFLLEVKKQGSPEKQKWNSAPTFNITGAQNIQIGDHNAQTVINVFNSLATEIDKSDAPEEQKKEAKQRLQAFLSHPIVSNALGGATAGIITGWFGK
jgi:hypothetical protein